MMKRRIVVTAYVFCFFYIKLFAQPTLTLWQKMETPICSADTAEARIERLLIKAKNATHYLDQIAYLQSALLYEHNARSGSSVVFELYRKMGFQLPELNPKLALYFLKKAFQIAPAPEEKRGNAFELAGAIAGIHVTLGEQDSALKWYRLAEAEARQRHLNIGHVSALNNLGVFYDKFGQRDSAFHYYNTALSAWEALTLKDSILYCSIRDNMAQEYDRQGQYHKALEIYRFNDHFYLNQKKTSKAVMAKVRTLNTLLKAGHGDLSSEIQVFSRFLSQSNNFQDKDLIVFYTFSKNYFLQTRQLSMAHRFDSLLEETKERFYRQNNEKYNYLFNAFLEVQASNFQRELALKQNEAENAHQMLRFTRLWAIWLVATIIAIFGILGWMANRRRRELDLAHRLTAAELRAKELESQAMAQSLSLKHHDLTMAALYNTQTRDVIRKVVERLLDILAQKDDLRLRINDYIRDLQGRELMNERSSVIQENLDQVSAEFYKTLKGHFPDLSKSEEDLCAYLRIGLSNKEVALLKNISPESVKMAKNRLRKKLHLNSDVDLQQFMRDFL